MGSSPVGERVKAERPAWHEELTKYERPDTRMALGQLATSILPFLGLWALMAVLVSKGYPYWITLALAVPAAGFLIRIFIIFHDCGHGSFLPSRAANRFVGYITGILTLTPFDDWRHAHALHHAASGDLDRRGDGDIWTMTVSEYEAAPWHLRLGYRLFRNPLVLFGLGPLFVFLVRHRWPHGSSGPREAKSVWITNAALLGIVLVCAFTIGLKTLALVHLPIMTIAGAAGVWLFYVQHQYEDVYWARHEEWDPVRAALDGSSYYRLPKLLQWFTGNIGFHHIHHLRSRIPNYRLQECFQKVPAMQEVHVLTIPESLKSLWMHLWDEQSKQLISFRAHRRRQLAR